MGLVINI